MRRVAVLAVAWVVLAALDPSVGWRGEAVWVETRAATVGVQWPGGAAAVWLFGETWEVRLYPLPLVGGLTGRGYRQYAVTN